MMFHQYMSLKHEDAPPMKLLNTPNTLTFLRLLVVPLFVLAYYWHSPWSDATAAGLFLLGAITDWLDGYLARRLNQSSAFGAFLDPVADKLLVAAALILLVSSRGLAAHSLNHRLFAVAVLVIIGREITISALREWMAELGRRASVAVSVVGKVKTVAQMTAIPFMLFRHALGGVRAFWIGEMLLYVAALLTLWSMFGYLRAAWPQLMRGTESIT